MAGKDWNRDVKTWTHIDYQKAGERIVALQSYGESRGLSAEASAEIAELMQARLDYENRQRGVQVQAEAQQNAQAAIASFEQLFRKKQ